MPDHLAEASRPIHASAGWLARPDPLWTKSTVTSPSTPGNPLPKAGPFLADLLLEYQAFRRDSSDRPFASRLASVLQLDGDFIGVQARASGSIDTLRRLLTDLGARHLQADAGLGIIEAMVPIDRLPTLDQAPEVASLSAIPRPTYR